MKDQKLYSLGALVDFVKFTHEIRNIRRAIILEEGVHENDTEHQYQTALVAWFIIETDNLKLDKFKCVGLAMLHDTAEARAGDITVYGSAEEKTAQKKREKEAVENFKKEWPNFKSLHELIHEYEERSTPEAKFVYALDKLIPVINNYLYKGKAWKQQKVTIEQERAVKKGKVDIDPTINEYFKRIQELLEQKPELYFWSAK